MSTRVFFKNNVGRSVAGLFLFASLLFCASCDRDELSSANAGKESGELIPVKVSVGGINGFSNGEQPVTRANAQLQNIAIPFNDDYKLQVNFQPLESAPRTRAAATPLKDGVKFRVLAYLQSIGTDRFKAYADYEVQAGGTVLNLLDGSLDLPSGTYKFVCYSYNTSDALPAFNGSTELEVTGIGSGTDFLRTIVTQKVEGDGVTLNINFDHFCSSLNVKVDASGIDGAIITDCSATLSGLKKSTASWDVSTATLNVSPGDIPNNLSFAWDSPSESVIESDAQIVMPTTNADLKLEFPSITIGGKTYTDKSVSLPKVQLIQGTSYTCTVNFVPEGIGLNPGDSTANCYIVLESNTKYYFDATKRGNGSNVPDISSSSSHLPDLTTATEARVIWQTGGCISSVSLKDKRVYFTTGTVTEGNAVIGIFPSSNPEAECLWSWHIWRLNGSAPGIVLAYKTNGATYSRVPTMDRNLGAYSKMQDNDGAIGLYYQWGRKDPFPGRGSLQYSTEPINIYGTYSNYGTKGQWNGKYSVATHAAIDDVAEAVKYPAVFIIASITGHPDWLITKNDNLWGTPITGFTTDNYNSNQGTKSIYDPCPVGYRVPPNDTWNRQTTPGRPAGFGIFMNSFTVLSWFPGAGFRQNDSGTLLIDQKKGYYWTSSPSKTNNFAARLYFDSYGTVTTNDYSNRANAMSVRCVAE